MQHASYITCMPCQYRHNLLVVCHLIYCIFKRKSQLRDAFLFLFCLEKYLLLLAINLNAPTCFREKHTINIQYRVFLSVYFESIIILRTQYTAYYLLEIYRYRITTVSQHVDTCSYPQHSFYFLL